MIGATICAYNRDVPALSVFLAEQRHQLRHVAHRSRRHKDGILDIDVGLAIVPASRWISFRMGTLHSSELDGNEGGQMLSSVVVVGSRSQEMSGSATV